MAQKKLCLFFLPRDTLTDSSCCCHTCLTSLLAAVTLQVEDAPSTDLVRYFPKCFEFIDKALSKGGVSHTGVAVEHKYVSCSRV